MFAQNHFNKPNWLVFIDLHPKHDAVQWTYGNAIKMASCSSFGFQTIGASPMMLKMWK
jgi:hypothetical protein